MTAPKTPPKAKAKTPKPEKAKAAAPESANTPETDKRAHLWKPGQSGNPNGRPAVVREIRDLARAHTTEAFDTLLSVCKSTDAPPAARVAAAAHILDRGYGKPTQNINAAVRNAQKMTDDELLAFLTGADEADGSDGAFAPPNDPGLPH